LLQNLGQHIRLLRKQKGIGLNEFAEMIDVSSGYLSNLETGKTDTIQLSLLQKLQDELFLFPISSNTTDDLMGLRLKKLENQLKELEQHHPEGVEYLLTTLEKGIDVLSKK
jgi:transcriptional regulator with XRE-family HTH domain